MPILCIHLGDDDHRALLLLAQQRGRAPEDLAEAAVENAILEAAGPGYRDLTNFQRSTQ